jgi:alginate O-acetyltransferase complex protein AlgI
VLFTEPTFLFAFLPVLLALYSLLSLLPSIPARNLLLVLASVVFYASGGGAFTWLMLASIAVNYLAALAIDRRRGTPAARRLLAVTVGANLVSLAVFKYAGFVVANLNAVLPALGVGTLAAPGIVLPIGISFFTFHAISYVVDVYRRDAVAQKGPVEAALYLLLFPQLIAGPIVRYRDIAAQLTARVVDRDGFATGIRRFVIGLGKKMLIANIVAVPADGIFALPPSELTAAHAWLAAACYTLQIYFDFSGYSDMAIGLAHLFGFRFKENFNYPYIASSIQDFWRRWHISLSAWFRDYLYVPLGGNRVPARRVYLNLVTVFFLCGLWHGASWTFVVWGLYHGAFLVLERLGLSTALARAPRPARHLYALLVVLVGWVFFRAESLTAAGGMLRAMAGAGAALPTPYGVTWYLTPEVVLAMAAGVAGSTPLWPALAARLARASADGPRLGPLPSALACAALAAVFAGCVMLIAAHTYNPFIYFRF